MSKKWEDTPPMTDWERSIQFLNDEDERKAQAKIREKKYADKKIFFKLRYGEMTDEFEALCFYFGKSQQGMIEICIREYFKMALGKHSGLKKALEVIRERDSDEEDI